ncbi:Mo-dependent nitrogenase C-terminal domain-containing protein [Egbenema bharatensis]|uniref:Mo-dependent nitrogenase C-terminal domain-containing protein n=1 Tax=Egbenema bharatensis TaxID=3463334 RepID=UPI003A890220
MKSLPLVAQCNPFYQLRQWLESIEILDVQTAQRICKLIPARCPFEHKIYLFDRLLLDIPPLCKLNPFYEQLIMLRCKALSYLANELETDMVMAHVKGRNR